MHFALRILSRDRRPRFVSPLPIAPRTVVLEPLFRENAVTLYAGPQDAGAAVRIREFQPAVIAGRLAPVLGLAGSAAPSHALVIFTGSGERRLNDRDRDALWRAYGVPVFEQVIADDGQLLAWECEAHNGLHLCGGAQRLPGFTVQTGMCDCGGSAPRVADSALASAISGEFDGTMPLLPARQQS